MSLRLRLLIATALTMLFALTVVDVTTYVLVRDAQVNQVDDTLDRAQTPVRQLASSRDRRDWLAIPAIAPGLHVVILDAGSIEFQSDPTPAGRVADPIAEPASLEALDTIQTIRTVGGDELRARVDRLAGNHTLIVGQSLSDVRQTTSTLLGILVGASGIAIVVAMLLAWWLVTSGLTPLRRVQSSASSITDDDLDEHRVPGARPGTEVGELALSLNAMLDRLKSARAEREMTLRELTESEARMRRFVADASHELRTPIAATAAYAELFEHGARDRPEDLDRAMAGIRNETERMAELVDDLLLLARLDENPTLLDEEVDLTELVLAAIDGARTVDASRPITLHVTQVVSVHGDRARLRQVVDNLLANVRAHTPSGTTCDVHLTDVGNVVELSVSDTGPGVPVAALPASSTASTGSTTPEPGPPAGAASGSRSLQRSSVRWTARSTRTATNRVDSPSSCGSGTHRRTAGSVRTRSQLSVETH